MHLLISPSESVCLQLSFLPLFPVEEERMNIRNIFIQVGSISGSIQASVIYLTIMFPTFNFSQIFTLMVC